MTPYYADDWLTVYAGDCREVLATMPAESVHCVVTSPPYWGLRDYGTATWLGGDERCDHRGGPRRQPQRDNSGGLVNNRRDSRGEQSWTEGAAADLYRHECGKCGATRQDSQLGLEPTPEEYVANMVAVFREVRRVLRADGTVWLNLGDSYASSPPGNRDYAASIARSSGLAGAQSAKYQATLMAGHATKRNTVVGSLKPKDLVGIPWRVAFALQADGWYLRSDIIWAKPNPMPESVTDRPTKAHEYLFLLSKSTRYYFDADAVREPHQDTQGLERFATSGGSTPTYDPDHQGWVDGGGFKMRPGGREYNPAGRNIRSVWTVATQPYPGAHFATFPEALVEPCVKAGTSERGVCPECGAPWIRVTEQTPFEGGRERERNVGGREDGFSRPPGGAIEWSKRVEPRTVGWVPSCALKHMVKENEVYNLEPVPATVLDPFAGSGTTGRVAQRLSRRAVLIDLSPDYLLQAMERNRDIPLGLEAG